eukprot:CAMPEP_0198226596 /NCGR_PEP_ID=MMETSP1445-20131203/105863_1 /TAXON_ID=36898 /ORGANISM="Pyramimonas sp., Strain CCMP2087" /LENGTH=260 /DNA_ID=CAMNT_0043906429 /DNA_START=67 /DNA_END=846 /DNA_ORIENTATION=-
MQLTFGSLGWYAFIAYLAFVGVSFYTLIFPKGCVHPGHWDCIPPSFQSNEQLHLRIYAHTSLRTPPPSAELILDRHLEAEEGLEDEITIPLKEYKARVSGALLYAHVYLMRSAEAGDQSTSQVAPSQEVLSYIAFPLSRLLPYEPVRERRHLLGSDKSGDKSGTAAPAGNPNISADLGKASDPSSPDPDTDRQPDDIDAGSCALDSEEDTCSAEDPGERTEAQVNDGEGQQLIVQQPDDSFIVDEDYPHLRPSVELRLVS